MLLERLILALTLCFCVIGTAAGGLFEPTPLGLSAPSLGTLGGQSLGGPLAIPALAIVGGIALISGIRRIKQKDRKD